MMRLSVKTMRENQSVLLLTWTRNSFIKNHLTSFIWSEHKHVLVACWDNMLSRQHCKLYFLYYFSILRGSHRERENEWCGDSITVTVRICHHFTKPHSLFPNFIYQMIGDRLIHPEISISTFIKGVFLTDSGPVGFWCALVNCVIRVSEGDSYQRSCDRSIRRLLIRSRGCSVSGRLCAVHSFSSVTAKILSFTQMQITT